MRFSGCKNNLYLEDYSNEDSIEIPPIIESKKPKEKEHTPSINLKSDVNSKGEKVVVFTINIPVKNKKNSLKIDILINDNMYKDIGKHFS